MERKGVWEESATERERKKSERERVRKELERKGGSLPHRFKNVIRIGEGESLFYGK
jgi:hypothetical protein